MKESHLLILWPGPCFVISIDIFEYKFTLLSKYFKGSIIGFALPEFMHLKTVGAFNFYTCKFFKNNIIRSLYSFFVIVKAVQLYYFKKVHFNVIISPNPLLTGLQAIIIGKLTGSKVVVEINGNFESALKFGLKGEDKLQLIDKLKVLLSHNLIRFVAFNADIVKLVYSEQLKPLKFKNVYKIKTVSFPNFVPINYFLEKEKTDDKYILLMGYPWFLKGVDILIKAFNLINPDFPDYKLKIVGWIPAGKEYYVKLANGNKNIELLGSVSYEEVVKFMTHCSLYVLASRTDSSPRVLREAMASKKPIIAANIDGVPELIKDNQNGLLFEKENVENLAQKIKMILGNKKLATRLAENGYRYVQEYLSEECYVKCFKKMIDEIFE